MEFIYNMLPEYMTPYTGPSQSLFMTVWEYTAIICKNFIVILVVYMIYQSLKEYYLSKDEDNDPHRHRRFICRNQRIYEVDWEYSNSSLDSESSGYTNHIM